MIVDTSALVAILHREPERIPILRALTLTNQRRMAAPNWLETCIVIDSRDNIHASARLERIVRRLGIEIAPFDDAMAHVAREAYRKFGKGRHPARLNFGDCVAYAMARCLNEPLLFKGNDFTQTDIAAAAY